MRRAGWVAVAGLLLGSWACGQGARAVPGPADGGTGSGGPGADAGDPGDAGPADGGADAGPTADCAGILPGAGAAYTFDVPASGGQSCLSASSDGKGILAVEVHDGGVPAASDMVQWYEFGTNGAAMGAFHGASVLYPQASGFEGLLVSGTSESLTLWDEGGSLTPYFLGDTSSPAVVERGWQAGTLVLRADANGLSVQKFDATGLPAASATIAGAFTAVAGAEDASGAVLAVVSGPRAMWVDLQKGTASAPFALGAGSAVTARALLGGGVAVALDGRWTALVQPGDAALHPPPAWLADGADIAIVRGGKAYALLRPGSNRLDLVSAQGNACGTATFSGASGLAVGLDGTIVGASGSNGCTKMFWPAALK